MNLMLKPVLVLNASYEALTIVRARRALVLVSKGAACVELATDTRVHPRFEIYLPSVIRLRDYKRIPVRLQVVSRRNILARDGHRCMYCGTKYKPEQLTLDHILPRSRGGRSTWDNLVACCARDNHRKGDKLPEEVGMHLVRRPLPQNVHTVKQLLRELGSEMTEWNRFLWHDNIGERRLQFN
jgi:5-methylcytosine-specific restriction endonuclease McrA